MFVLLGVVFVLKLVVLVQLKDHPLASPDSGLDTTAYVQLARRVLGGDLGLGPGLYYVSPFYIYFLASLLWVFDSFTVVRLTQIALGTASVGLVFLTTRRWFGERAAWAAAALAGLTGLFTFYEVLILQSSVDAFFTSAALYALTRGLTDLPAPPGRPDAGRRRMSWILFAGVIWGVQTLNRPNVLIAACLVAVTMLVVMRRVRMPALLIAGLLVGMSPVAIRNLTVSHEWTLVSSHGGLNFYIGNSERATGFYQIVPGVTPSIVGQETDTRRIAERALGRPVTDADVSDYFFDLGWSWIKAHPASAAGLFIKKFAFAFHAQHLPLPHSYPFFAYDSGTALRFYAIGPWLLVPLGLVGLVVAADRSRVREYLVWVSFVPGYAGAIALFFIAERYRLALLVPLAIGAGAAIDVALRAASAKRWSVLLPAAAAVVALAALVNFRVALDDGRWTEGLRLAERLVILERYEEAEQWAEWLETHQAPRPGAGLYGVGTQLLALNRTDRALSYLERAYRANPADARHDYAYGQALLQAGRARDAVPHLKHGFEAGVELPAGGYDYALALKDSGDLPGAAAAVRRIHPADSADADAWMRLGRLAMEAKDPGAAEPFFRHASEMAPALAAARQQYGLNLLVLGRFDAAAHELAEASRLDPRNADSLAHLAFAELKLDRPGEARMHVAQALSIDPNQPLALQLQGVLR